MGKIRKETKPCGCIEYKTGKGTVTFTCKEHEKKAAQKKKGLEKTL